MKIQLQIIALLFVSLSGISCSGDITVPVSFSVSLSEGNTYRAGEPVCFDLSGQVDNLVFYSGEAGHRYEMRDRYEYEPADIESITLDINYGIWYGQTQTVDDPTQLETFICTSWDDSSITWSDAAADSVAFLKMSQEGMPGWERLGYTDDITKIGTYVPYSYTLDAKYVDGLVIAFHFKPIETYTYVYWRRFYNIYGLLTTRFAGSPTPFTMDFFSMTWQTFMINTAPEAHYKYVTDKCGVKIASSGAYTVRFDARRYYSTLPWPLPEAWAICKPIKMNKANPDSGESIKNLQNELERYRYVYDAPGTYKAVFVGTNRTYIGSSRQVRELEFTVY